MLLSTMSLLEGSWLTVVPENVISGPPGVIVLPSTDSPEGSAAKVSLLVEGVEGLTTLATSMVLLSIATRLELLRLLGVPDTFIPGPPANTVVLAADKPGDPTVKDCPPAVEVGAPETAIAGPPALMSTVCEGDRLLSRLGAIVLVENLNGSVETSAFKTGSVDPTLGSNVLNAAELWEDLGPPSKLCTSAPIPWLFSAPFEILCTEIEDTWAGLTGGIDVDLPGLGSCCKAVEDGIGAESAG